MFQSVIDQGSYGLYFIIYIDELLIELKQQILDATLGTALLEGTGMFMVQP